jgi:hypothetical protein
MPRSPSLLASRISKVGVSGGRNPAWGDHGLHLDCGQAERDHRLGMRVDDRHDVRARLVNLAMNVALAVDAPAPGVNRLAVGRPQLHDVLRRNEGGRHGTRHKEDVRISCGAHRDVTEAVKNALVHQDLVSGDQVGLALDIGITSRRLGEGMGARGRQDRNGHRNSRRGAPHFNGPFHG